MLPFSKVEEFALCHDRPLPAIENLPWGSFKEQLKHLQCFQRLLNKMVVFLEYTGHLAVEDVVQQCNDIDTLKSMCNKFTHIETFLSEPILEPNDTQECMMQKHTYAHAIKFLEKEMLTAHDLTDMFYQICDYPYIGDYPCDNSDSEDESDSDSEDWDTGYSEDWDTGYIGDSSA